jgi:hypothetical protein
MGEDFDIAESLDGSRKSFGSRIGIPNVCFKGYGIATAGFNLRNDLVGFQPVRFIHDGYRSAAGSKLKSDGATDATASSGYERGATRKLAHALYPIAGFTIARTSGVINVCKT